MIFLTVGTQFPFDRLVQAVDNAFDKCSIDEEIFAQIGESSYKPRNFTSVASLEKKVFDEYLQKATGIISHAGIGTLKMALDSEKPLLVMPRLKKYGEVVNDHQVAFAKRFEKLGHIMMAYDVEDLTDTIRKFKNFIPLKREANPGAVADRIGRFINCLSKSR